MLCSISLLRGALQIRLVPHLARFAKPTTSVGQTLPTHELLGHTKALSHVL